VGNLPSGKEENRVVSKIECIKLAATLFTSPVRYIEVNTRSGTGVANVFSALMESVYGVSYSGAEKEQQKALPATEQKAPNKEASATHGNDKDEEIRLLKAQQAALEAKLAAMTARFEALEARQRAEEKAAEKRFEAMEAKVSEASLTQRIEELLLAQLKKIGWNRGSSPPKTAAAKEIETPPKVRPVTKQTTGGRVKQGLFGSTSVP